MNTAREFNERLDFNGVVLTKLDGDTRGGAALSIRTVVNTTPLKSRRSLNSRAVFTACLLYTSIAIERWGQRELAIANIVRSIYIVMLIPVQACLLYTSGFQVVSTFQWEWMAI